MARPSQAEVVDRPDVLILATNNLSRDIRVLKEARSLHSAGLVVARMGIVTHPDDAEHESSSEGEIFRVRTTTRLASERPSQSGNGVARRRRGPGSDLRHFAGRLRENWRIFKVARGIRSRCVIACDLDTLPAGVGLKIFTGARLVYDSHELWIEQSSSNSRLFKMLYGGTEAVLVRFADAVVTVNRPIARELARRYRISEPLVVMNGSECRSSQPRPTNMPIRLLYQGGYCEERGLEALVDSMAGLEDRAVLTLQGFGPLESVLRERVAAQGLSQVVVFAEACDPLDVVENAANHDVGVVSYQPTNLNNFLASPNKLFDYLAAGIAVLGVRIPVLEEVIGSTGAGVLYDPDDSAALGRAISDIADDAVSVYRMKEAAVAICPSYSWRSQEGTLLAAVMGPDEDGRP